MTGRLTDQRNSSSGDAAAQGNHRTEARVLSPGDSGSTSQSNESGGSQVAPADSDTSARVISPGHDGNVQLVCV